MKDIGEMKDIKEMKEMKEMKTEDFVTIKELAQLYRVSKKTIYNRIAEGEIPSYPHPLNHRIRIIKKKDIQRLVKLKNGAKSVEGN